MTQPDGLDQMMVLRDNAKSQLMQIKSVEDGITYLNKLASIETWVRAEKKDAELQNIVAEQKLRTQRILGELISEGQRKGTIRKQVDTPTTVPSDARELGDIGLTRKQSSAFKQIAEIPDDKFEKFIHEKKQAVNNAVSELTTTGAMKLAKSLQEKKSDTRNLNSLADRMRIEKELHEIADKINKCYNKDQRIYFINLIKQ